MDSITVLSLVNYIQRMHSGQLDRGTLFACHERELKGCSAHEVNIAIENLIVRYKNVEDLEQTVARFIRAASQGLRAQQRPEYPKDSIFFLLDRENRTIAGKLENLKREYKEALPGLKRNEERVKLGFRETLEGAYLIRNHYHKLQYGVFSALEAAGAPVQCSKLMWHLQNTVWLRLKESLGLLEKDVLDLSHFNTVYGQLFFLIGSLLFREDEIFYPVAYRFLSERVQRTLLQNAQSHSSITS